MTGQISSPNLFVAKLKAARKADDQLARRVSRAIQGGDIKAAKDATAVRLKSSASLLVAADRFNKDLPVEERLSVEQLVEAVSRVDMRRESTEPVRVVDVRKGNGGWRETNDFGNADRIAQTLLVTCLEPFSSLYVRDYQFGVKGRSFDPAIATVRQHIAAGLEWAAELDIENCFGSLNREGLVDLLPLPSGIVLARVAPSVVMTADAATWAANTALRADTVSPVPITGEITSGVLGAVYSDFCIDDAASFAPPARQGHGGVAARRVPLTGLPQGGLHSSLAAAIVLGQVLAGVEHRIGKNILLVWGDNILVLGRTRDSVRKTARHLQLAFRQTSAGPLNARLRYIHHVDKGFEWIGFKFRRRIQGDLLVTPTPANMRKFCRRAKRLTHRRVRSWRAHFAPHWPNCIPWTRRVLKAAAGGVHLEFRLTGVTAQMAKRALDLAGMGLPAAGRNRRLEVICRHYLVTSSEGTEPSLEDHLALLQARFGVSVKPVEPTDQNHSR